ncbi:MAG: hypothetical protein JSR86_17650 [Proteobacteria bacterium]|nr:hypothetical protein [Pseudomonadota bacterium]
MPDRVALPVLALIAVAMIALALVWPQGQGRRSPGPFGVTRPPATPTAAPSGPALRPAH